MSGRDVARSLIGSPRRIVTYSFKFYREGLEEPMSGAAGYSVKRAAASISHTIGRDPKIFASVVAELNGESTDELEVFIQGGMLYVTHSMHIGSPDAYSSIMTSEELDALAEMGYGVAVVAPGSPEEREFAKEKLKWLRSPGAASALLKKTEVGNEAVRLLVQGLRSLGVSASGDRIDKVGEHFKLIKSGV